MALWPRPVQNSTPQCDLVFKQRPFLPQIGFLHTFLTCSAGRKTELQGFWGTALILGFELTVSSTTSYRDYLLSMHF